MPHAPPPNPTTPHPAKPKSLSEAAFAKAKHLMPGGVSSPVRAFNAVGGTPLFIREAEGANVTDLDGRTYIDFVGSYGPMIVGHANERVVAALSKAIGRGTSYGAPTEAETALASLIVTAIPSVQLVRFVNSGTEAAMSAIRLARAATSRDLVIKCAGCYHGHADGLLVQAGSGAATLGVPTSPGVPKPVAAETIVVPYNDLDAAAHAFDHHHNKIAAFVVEPVAGNMGLVPPEPGYLQGLRQLCDKQGSLLIFDEVMTGFRVAWGGAQVRYRVKADLTCLGKIIGGGLPVGAYGGKKDLMKMISPAGPVYQAGTLSGNPLAMAGGIATLEILREPGTYETLEERAKQLEAGLTAAAQSANVPLVVNRVGSMLSPFFVSKAGSTVKNFADASSADTKRYAQFFHSMLDHGIYLPPSQFEAWFISLAHTARHIDTTIQAASEAMKAIK
jgi:glutamate-1-semialdehyde 2,1-aminomutase